MHQKSSRHGQERILNLEMEGVIDQISIECSKKNIKSEPFVGRYKIPRQVNQMKQLVRALDRRGIFQSSSDGKAGITLMSEIKAPAGNAFAEVVT